jgi:hypothetical protein
MSLNAIGVRDTARALPICPNTVLRERKKKETTLESVNTTLLRTLNPAEAAWDVERAGEAEAEMDEMWSFVGNKGNPRWLWHAIDHHTGKVLGDFRERFFLFHPSPWMGEGEGGGEKGTQGTVRYASPLPPSQPSPTRGEGAQEGNSF